MRKRTWQTALIVVVLALGLFSRSRSVAWSWWVTTYVGDALWAWLVFLGIGWLWTRWSTLQVVWRALTFGLVIEFSQLIHMPWLDAMRTRRWAAQVLGQGFLWSDLISYVVGIAVGAWIERCLCGKWFTSDP